MRKPVPALRDKKSATVAGSAGRIVGMVGSGIVVD